MTVHKGALERLEAAVSAVLPLLDEPDQEMLRTQLEELSHQYDGHVFECEGYLVERWVEAKEGELSGMALTAVQPPTLQVWMDGWMCVGSGCVAGIYGFEQVSLVFQRK